MSVLGTVMCVTEAWTDINYRPIFANRNQINIDISPVVIKQMSKNYPNVDFKLGDVTKLEYEVSQHLS